MYVLKVFALTTLLAGSIAAQGTGSIRGVVRHDGKAVEGAVVRLAIGQAFTNLPETKTGADGTFVIDNVAPNEYLVQAYFNLSDPRLFRLDRSHLQAEVTVRVDAGATQTVELNIVPVSISSQHRVSEYVTVAADIEQRPEEVSKTVDAITAQEMRDRADFTLVDSVRTIPGFRVQQLGGFGRTASIKARGLRNQDTAVLIDGIRFRDPGAINGDASPFLSDITLTNVSGIEVLRGSGSSLYGTNAIGGTLDFQTPSRQPTGVHGQISGAAGGLGLGRGRGLLSYGSRDDKFGFSGGASRTSYTSGVDGDDDANNTNVQTRVDYKPFSQTHLSGRFFFSNADVRLNVSPEVIGVPPPTGAITPARPDVNFRPDQNDPDSTQTSRFGSGQFAVSHAFNDDLVIGGYHQTLVTKRRNEDGPLGPGFFQSAFTSDFGGTINTSNVNVKWMPNYANTFTAGYEFENEHFRNSGTTPSGTSDFWTRAGQRSNTLYAQHVLSILDGDLQFAGGIRAQWFSLSEPEFSATDGPYSTFDLNDPPAAYIFDGSASYYFSSTRTKIRSHVGNGYRVPSLYERFGTFFFLGFFSPQGNPDLKPERSLGVDAGIDQYVAGNRLKLSATFFYTKIKDEITYLPTDDFTAPAYYNFDRHYSRGIETSIQAKPTSSTDIFWSYTFTNSDVRNFARQNFIVPFSTDRRAFGIPNHQFSLVATKRFGTRFWVTFDLLATSSYLAPVFDNATFRQHTYRFKGNRRGDLTAGYTFSLKGDMSLRVFATIENMFDQAYFENGFRTPGINGRGGLSFAF